MRVLATGPGGKHNDWIGDAFHVGEKAGVCIVAWSRSNKLGKCKLSNVSPFAYVVYGAALCAIFKDYHTGYQFGELALKANNKFGGLDMTAKVLLYYGGAINIWANHMHQGIPCKIIHPLHTRRRSKRPYGCSRINKPGLSIQPHVLEIRKAAKFTSNNKIP